MDDLGPLCSLADPRRRQLYDYVADADGPVTREQASAALGMDRALAAYHLDKLVEEGLLAAFFARPEGRRAGPGAGRPAKHYRRADREFTVSLPVRDYRLAAEVFARAAETEISGVVRGSLEGSAAAMGRELAGSSELDGDLADQLRAQGFEPYNDGGILRLGNCPFHQLARAHTELVCGLNLAMLTGMAQALGVDIHPLLDPGPDRCCVAFHPA